MRFAVVGVDQQHPLEGLDRTVVILVEKLLDAEDVERLDVVALELQEGLQVLDRRSVSQALHFGGRRLSMRQDELWGHLDGTLVVARRLHQVAGVVVHVTQCHQRLRVVGRQLQRPQVFASSGRTIKSIQRGTITITDTNSTNTATITAVVTAKTSLQYLGNDSDNSSSANAKLKIVLTNSTTITASRASTTGIAIVSFEVVEYN